MREKFGFLICVWFLLCGNCLGSYVAEKNSLTIISPESIKGVYDCLIGNLGVPQYGGNLAAFVVYPRANRRGCRDFYDFGVSFKLRPGSFPVILLVDRGDCFFALKVWNAQKAGAAAVLIVDDIEEPLITMDTPEENYSGAGYYLQNITIPSALITKSLGNSIKKALTQREIVVLNLDWRSQSLPHPEPDEPILEYELWTNSNYECGPKCQTQIDFINTFKKAAQMLEQKGYTQFTPHYITWYCPQAFVFSKQCKSQCIRHGRYCAPDPELDFSKGYDGKDVVVQTLREACFFKVAKQSGKPWLWWDYVTDFAVYCTMKQHMYNKQCADQVILSLGVDVAEIDDCIGDPEADVEHPVLKAEQISQTGKGTRGDVTILPTLVINNRVYKGKLYKAAVLKAICAGFQGTNTKPPICLSEDVEEANAYVLRKEW